MPRTEDEEVAELKQMFRSPSKKMRQRPPWNSTPLRNRPSQLKGLNPVTPEPWKIDEDFYNRKFETRDVGIQDRYLDRTARDRYLNHNQIDYRCRFDAKYVEMDGTLNKYDGNPFT